MTEKTITINIPSVEKWTLRDLKSVCRHHKINGYAKMNRDQLIVHVREILGHTEN
ncbi:Ish1 domain-containing protein [Bacillus cereus]|uniref:Ish1 domain-containing protein n=1 Tax=Bacillus cereus TaxID=1396 RepID=UPI0002EC376F|nr:Ish1 domain-containing protein [Bacillus cereus]